MMNHQQRLMFDIFRYAERQYVVSQMLGAGVLVLCAVAFLYASRLLAEPGAVNLVLLVALSAMIHGLVRRWRVLRERLSVFETTATARGPILRVARLHPGMAFHPVPARFVSQATAPAPAGVCWDLERHAERHPQLRVQLAACKRAHGAITNHDAANLLLMALSMAPALAADPG